MTVKFPCKICEKPVPNNHHVIQYDSCHFKISIHFRYTVSAINL